MTQTLAEPRIFTTSEFASSVLALAPRIAVFDCDGTLWSGDAGSSFMAWTIDRGLLSRASIDALDDRYRAYKRGQVSELAICGEMVQVYAGLRETELRTAAAEFFRTRIEPHIFPELAHLVAALQHAGTELWAVSSTNHWVIEEGVQRFGIPAARVLAARAAVENGLITSRLLDVPTDQGKVEALRRAGVPHPDAVFGNSIHDAAMLTLARHPYPVNPTPALVEYSRTAGWPVYYPESVHPLLAIPGDQSRPPNV